MTNRDRWAKRPAVLRYWAYGDELRLRLPGYEIPASLTITFHLPMPGSWSKKKQAEMLGKPHQVRPDTDNLVKAFLDLLAVEDGYVWHVNAKKYWAQTGSIEIED